jgi:hypothetical protein
MTDTNKFAWANGTVEEVATLLAEKTCKLEKTALEDLATYGKQLQQLPGQMASQAVKDQYGNITDALNWGVGGAGIGALVGGVSSLAAPKKKRHMLSDITTGALVGGAGGAGLGLLNNTLLNPDPGHSSNALHSAVDRADALTKAQEKFQRGDFPEKNTVGWWQSRLQDLYNRPGNAWNALVHGGQGGIHEALSQADVLGLRHVADPNIGMPLGPNVGRGGFLKPWTGVSTGTFHGDLLAGTATTDALLTAWRRLGIWREPEYLLKALNDPTIGGSGKYNPEAVKALIADLQKQPSKLQQTRLIGGRDPNTGVRNAVKGYQAQTNLSAQELAKATQTLPDRATINKLTPEYNLFNQNLEKTLNERLDFFRQQDPTLVSGNTLANPATSHAAADAYVNRLGARPEFSRMVETLRNANATPQEIAQQLYVAAKRYSPTAEQLPIEALEQLQQYNSPAEFSKLLTPNKLTLNAVPNLASRGNVYKETGLPKQEFSPDIIQDLGRPTLSSAQRLQMNAATLEGPAWKAISRMTPQQIEQAGLVSGKGYTHLGERLSPEQMATLNREGAAVEMTPKSWTGYLAQGLGGATGGTRRPFGGVLPFTNTVKDTLGTWKNISEAELPLYTKGKAYLRAPFEAGALNTAEVAGRIPRGVGYLAPLVAQELINFAGNRLNPITGKPDYPFYGTPESAQARTPELKPFIDQNFTNNSESLAKLLSTDQAGKSLWANKPMDITPREKLEMLKVLDSKDPAAVKRVNLMKILGFLEPGKPRPYQYTD